MHSLLVDLWGVHTASQRVPKPTEVAVKPLFEKTKAIFEVMEGVGDENDTYDFPSKQLSKVASQMAATFEVTEGAHPMSPACAHHTKSRLRGAKERRSTSLPTSPRCGRFSKSRTTALRPSPRTLTWRHAQRMC